MKKSYKKQILNHNIKIFNQIIKANLDNLNIFTFAKILIKTNQNAEFQVNLINDTKKIMKDLKQHFGKDECQKLQYNYLSTNYWYLAKIVTDKTNIPGLVDALTVFIKQEQAKVKGIENMCNGYYKDDNSSQADKYSIQIHSSIAIQKIKKIIKEKYNTNARQCNKYLNNKRAKITGNMTIYEYKNIIQAQQTSKKFHISDKIE